MTYLLVLFFALFAHAESFDYELKSQYLSPKLNQTVNFTLNWSEKEGVIRGQYKDNIMTTPLPIKGIVTKETRIFRFYPNHPREVNMLTIISSHNPGASVGKKVPVSIIAQNGIGSPRAMNEVATLVALTQAQKEEAKKCTDGLGKLAGHCGDYVGLISKESDPSKKCTLESGDVPHLLMDEQGTLALQIGPTSQIVTTPKHMIGRIPADIDTNRVDVMTRQCRPLAGTNFPGDDCKRVNLTGTFTEDNRGKHFAGNYIIVDENTNQRCRYRLSMDQRTPTNL